MKPLPDEERIAPLAELGEQLAHLRLREAAALDSMRRSLRAHGQLSPIVVFPSGSTLEIIDGFKRAAAARSLGWASARVCILGVDAAEAKVLLAALHDRRGLTELEEGWLCRSLYRDDNLSQPAIAQRLGRHKSWVCRRLILVESLDAAVQADVRLGLLAPRAAVALGQLPRGNQRAAAEIAIRRGLTVRQTELFVAELMDCPTAAARESELKRRMEGPEPSKGAAKRPSRKARNEADWISMDIRTLRNVAARLQARLTAAPLCVLGGEVAELIIESLAALQPVLGALVCTIDKISAEKGEKARDAA